MQDTQKIKKIELEHKKLLAEYNSILIALASVTIGITGLIYTLTKKHHLKFSGFSNNFSNFKF